MFARLALIGILLSGPSAIAQTRDSTLPQVLVVRQVSWWAPDGLPATDIAARETTLVFEPDSLRGWPATGTMPVVLRSDPGAFLQASLEVPNAGVETVLVSAEEARCGATWADPPTSSLVALTLLVATPADPSGEEARPLPLLTFGACRDTVWAAFERTIHPYRADASPGRSVFLYLQGSLDAVWHIERNLVPGGTPVRHGSLAPAGLTRNYRGVGDQPRARSHVRVRHTGCLAQDLVGHRTILRPALEVSINGRGGIRRGNENKPGKVHGMQSMHYAT